MAGRILQERQRRVNEAAAAVGATVVEGDRMNLWDVAVLGTKIGQLRYEPRARVWLATTGTKSTVGDLVGCVRFVVQYC